MSKVTKSTKSVNSCVLVDWFFFPGQCQIHSCKYNTNMLETGCIALERKDTHGKKLLTDRELRYYKFENTIPVTSVTSHRKKVLNDSKKLIALYYYSQYVLNNCSIKQLHVNKIHEKLLKRFPLRLSKLHMTPMLLCNMLTPENFQSFKKSVKLEEDYSINDLLMIPDKKWQKIQSLLGENDGLNS